MSLFTDVCLPLTLVFEGTKFTNHPADKGGPTKFGIIQKVYDNYRASKGIALQSVEFIEKTEYEDIYYTNYWLPSKCDQMPAKVATVTFDSSVNNGPGRSVKFLQAALGVTVDGVIGPKTLAALKTLDDNKVSAECLNSKEAFYRAIVARDPTQLVFLTGWLRRVAYLRDFLTGVKTLEQVKATW